MERHIISAALVISLCICWGCARSSAPPGKSTASTNTASPIVKQTDHPAPPEPIERLFDLVEVRTSGRRIRNVYVDDRNITGFTNPHYIYDAELSPEDDYLLVEHMDFRPRKISVYDMASGKPISTFAPGAGGDFKWAAHNLIYHQYGAGTNTAFFEVYSIQGKKVWGGFSSGASLDESGRYVLVYPTLDNTKEQILVADIRNGDVIGQVRPPDVDCVNQHSWLDAHNIRFWYLGTDGANHSVDIKLHPDHPLRWDTVYHPDTL